MADKGTDGGSKQVPGKSTPEGMYGSQCCTSTKCSLGVACVRGQTWYTGVTFIGSEAAAKLRGCIRVACTRVLCVFRKVACTRMLCSACQRLAGDMCCKQTIFGVVAIACPCCGFNKRFLLNRSMWHRHERVNPDPVHADGHVSGIEGGVPTTLQCQQRVVCCARLSLFVIHCSFAVACACWLCCCRFGSCEQLMCPCMWYLCETHA